MLRSQTLNKTYKTAVTNYDIYEIICNNLFVSKIGT